MLQALRERAHRLRRDAHALYLAARDPRTPWYAKALAAVVAAYALSPIDLVPDFIPVLGYLDDLILVPLGVALVVLLIPGPLMVEHRAAAARAAQQPVSRRGLLAIIATWLGGLVLAAWLAYRVVA